VSTHCEYGRRKEDYRLMALKQDDFVRAVAKLNELTRARVIKWTRSDSLPKPRGGGLGLGIPNSINPKISFQTAHEGRVLRITQYEPPNLQNLLGLGGAYTYVLDVSDQGSDTAFEFPDVEGISDLFRSAQTQELDIEGFIRNLAST
jgi:hypothetical protein